MPKSPEQSNHPPRGCGYANDRASRAPVVSARRMANLANAGKSTGPRTAAGKATSSRNALRHGLRASAAIPSEEIEPIAAALSERPLAWAAAELTLRLVRIREEKAALFNKEGEDVSKALPALTTLAGYERKAWSLRQRALRALDAKEEPIWPNEANLVPGLIL